MRRPLLASGILGFTGVALGAFGAHALRDTLVAAGMEGTWETAVFYHLVHAVALAAIAGRGELGDFPWLRRAGVCWVSGVVLFSGSLYGLSLSGPGWLVRWGCTWHVSHSADFSIWNSRRVSVVVGSWGNW